MLSMNQIGDVLGDAAWSRIEDDLFQSNVSARKLKMRMADEIINEYISISQGSSSMNNCKYKDILSNDAVKSFFTQTSQVPQWLNWTLIELGHDVFVRYSGAALLGLLCYSLVGGFSSPKIVEVLYQSSDLTKSVDVTWKRLVETLEMVIDCTSSRDALKVGHIGWKAVIRTRFIHCAVRYHILHSKQSSTTSSSSSSSSSSCPFNHHMSKQSHTENSNSPSWNIHEKGMPINQEHMICTLLAFSYNIIHVMQFYWAPLTSLEIEAYIHYWRYIGYLLGIDDKYNSCESYQRATTDFHTYVLPSLDMTTVNQSQGPNLARHVLLAVSNRWPTYWSYSFQSELACAMLGESYAQNLQLQRSLYHRLLVYGFVFMIRMITRFIAPYRDINGMHILKVKALRRKFVNYHLSKE